MDWWMVGLALAALVAVAAWDVGRADRAVPSALLALRAVGGLGLTAMAALSLSVGAREAALVAAVAAAPLLVGLLRAARPAAEVPETVSAAHTAAHPPAPVALEEERRAA